MQGGSPILIVGEDPAIVDLLRTVVDACGYPVVASSGERCLTQHLAPCLVLLDLDVAPSDGVDRARRIRHWLGSQVPLVVLTAEDNPRALARECGAQGWLPKPFDLDDLIAKVRRLTT